MLPPGFIHDLRARVFVQFDQGVVVLQDDPVGFHKWLVSCLGISNHPILEQRKMDPILDALYPQ